MVAAGEEPELLLLLELIQAHGALVEGGPPVGFGIAAAGFCEFDDGDGADGGCVEALKFHGGGGVDDRRHVELVAPGPGEVEAADEVGAAQVETALDGEDVVADEEDGGGEDAEDGDDQDGEAGVRGGGGGWGWWGLVCEGWPKSWIHWGWGWGRRELILMEEKEN